MPLLEGGLPLLEGGLNEDVENKRLPVKELPLLEGEPNREQKQDEFVEGLVEFVRLGVGLNELSDVGGLDVGLDVDSDVGVDVVGRQGVDVDAVGRLGVGVVGAVSLPRHL